MASDLDKFVLEYKVELKDSLARLQELQKKIEGVGKADEKLKKGKSELRTELEKVSPTFKTASTALEKFGTIAGRVAGIAALLAAAIHSVNKAMEEYNKRAEVAWKTGVGTIGITNFERNMRAASGGRVGRAGARQAMGSVSDLIMEAYTDPTRMGTANRKLQRLGISPTGPGGGITSTESAITQLSTKLAQVSNEQAIAMGQLIGLTPQATEALKALGAESMKAAHMTDEEASRKLRAAEAAKRLQGAYNGISEAFDDMVQTIGDSLMPSFADLMEGVKKMTEWLADATRSITDFGDRTARFFSSLASHWQEIFKGASVQEIIDKAIKESAPIPRARVQNAESEYYRFTREHLAQETLNINTFSNAVSTFAGAVNKNQAWAAWAGAVGRAAGLEGSSKGGLTPNEIRGGGSFNAAGYGEAYGNLPTGGGGEGGGGTPVEPPRGGGASGDWNEPAPPRGGGASGNWDEPPTPTGKSGGKQTRGIRNNNPGNLRYNTYTASLGATGKDADGFAIFPSMQAGVTAMRALLSGKGYVGGGRNTISSIISKYAPSSENNTSAYIAAVSKATGLDPNAQLTGAQLEAVQQQMMVHESGYRGGGGGGAVGVGPNAGAPLMDSRNPNAKATFGFSGPRIPLGDAESQDTLGLNLVQQAVASRLNVSPEQLQQGRVTKGDVGWAGSQIYTGLVNSRRDIIQQLSNPALQPFQKEQAANQLRDVNMQMASMMNFMPELMANAKEGGRQYSIGDVRINVSAGAVSDPEKLAKAIRKELQMTLTQLVNSHASGDKG